MYFISTALLSPGSGPVGVSGRSGGSGGYNHRSAHSLAVQIQRANFWLTMLIVLCLGGSMLGLSLREVLRIQDKENQLTVNLIGQILTTEVKNRINSITDLASNPVTWTSLTDTTGRETHLKPTLAARENSLTASPTALFDYKGRYLAGNQPDAPNPQRLAKMIAAVLADKKQQLILVPSPHMKLVVAQPVIYPYTQDVIGVLTGEIDLQALFTQHVQLQNTDVAVEIRHGNQVLLTTATSLLPVYVPVTFDFPWSLNEPRPEMAVWLYSTQDPWWMHTARLLGWGLLLGAVLTWMVWRVSHHLAQRLTARIERLAYQCEAIGQGQSTQVTPDTQEDEIGMLSRTLAQALSAYHDINQNLEAMVAQETQALSESESRFRGFFENNALVMFQIAPHTGQVLLANQAAADFYGYSRHELMAMNVTDINSASTNQTKLNLALAEHQNRRSFVFQHRLRSGEVRDVQVHSTPMQINQKLVLFSVVHDITKRLAAERKLKISDQALMSISQGVLVTDAQMRIVSVNHAFSVITGYSAEEVINRRPELLHGSETNQATYETITQMMLAGNEFDGEIVNYRKNGQRFWNALTISPMLDEHGALSNCVGVMRDITENKKTQERLQLAANVFTFAREGIMITRADSTIIEANETLSLITGYHHQEIVGRKPQMFGSGRQDSSFFADLWAALQANGHWHGEVWNRRKNGEFYAAMLNISAVRNGKNEIDYFVALYTDITSKKNQEQILMRSAHYDALTGLPNRALFADRLQQAVLHAIRRKKWLSLVYLDLDGFKTVNDIHGHSAGDSVLIAAATRMQDALREGDTLARVGGDEFVAILVDLVTPEESRPIMERMLLAASLPVTVQEGVVVQVSASLGATYFPQPAQTSAEQLMEQADQTMYHAKQSGKNRIHVFDAAQNQPVSI